MTTPEQKKDGLEEINAQLLQIWQAIKLSGWSATVGLDLARRLARLSRISSQNHWLSLGDRALDIEVYLSSFLDGDLVPDKAQLQVLQGLVRDCRSAIRSTRRDESRASKKSAKRLPGSDLSADDSPKTAFVLKSDENKYLGLATALGSHQFVVRPFFKAEDLLAALDTEKPSVLILQRQFIDALDSIDGKLYRDREGENEHTAIVILSSDNSPEERLKAMRAGVDAFIPEPFTEAAVLAQIESLLTDDQRRPFQVMIIDDDRQQAIICSAILRRKGMLTQVCTSGQEALQELSAFGPDLIVVDLHMPEMDGLQFTAQVREQQEFFTVPIIFLSGDDDPQTRFDALSLGGNDFLVKPIRPNHLISAVWSRLKFSRKLRRYLGNPADKDEKTGLYQFSRLLEMGENLFETGVAEHQVYLFQIGLGNIAELEDRFGATEILELQQHLAGFIVSQFRKSDVIASQRYFLFSALVKGLSEQQAGELASRMLGHVKGRLLHLDRFTFSTSLCIGMCKLVDAIGDINHAVRLSAKACQQACDDGGNRWVVQVPEGAQNQNQNQVEQLLQLLETDDASSIKQILLQPLLRVRGQRSHQYRVGLWLCAADGGKPGVEALAIADLDPQTRSRLDLWTLAHGLQQIQQGQPDGAEVHARVPLGLETLNDDLLVEFIESALGTAQLKPTHLTVVLNRNLAMGALDSLIEVMESVHKLGVKIGLEGITGRQSELEFIERFPIASVELDHSMLQDQLHKKAEDPSVHSIVQELHALGVEVVMPAIQNSEGLAELWKLNLDYAYGDFIQAPMEQANFEFE